MALSHIVGVEIDAHTIRAIEVKGANTAKPTVFATAETNIPSSKTSSDELPDETELAIAFEKLWQEGKFSTRDVVLGIGAQKVLVREETFPLLPEKDLATAIPLHIRGTLQVPVDEAVVDFYPTDINDSEEDSTITGILISAPVNTLQKITQAAHTAKLRIESIDFSAFALSRLMRALDSKGVTMLNYLGQHSSFIVINKDGSPDLIRVLPVGRYSLFQRVMQVAGDRIDPRILLELFPDLPEELGDLDFDPITKYVNQIIRQITATQDYYADNRGTAVNKLLVLGVSHKNKGIQDLTSATTQLPITHLEISKLFKFRNQYLSALLKRNGTFYAVALGLTLRGVK